MKNINIKNRGEFVGIIGMIVLLCFLICCGGALYWYFFHRADSSPQKNDAFSSESTFKFADLVQSGVLYPVVHVMDGDTINVRVPDPAKPAGDVVTIRLIGIDTPETVDPRKPVQCYGPEASAKAKEIFASTSVYLERDPAKGDYDKYGRVLAYVRLADGSSYNEYMLKNGFAREYTYFNQPYKYQAEFKTDEAIAKKAKIGLWGRCINN